MRASWFDTFIIVITCFHYFKAKFLIEIYGTFVVHLNMSENETKKNVKLVTFFGVDKFWIFAYAKENLNFSGFLLIFFESHRFFGFLVF